MKLRRSWLLAIVLALLAVGGTTLWLANSASGLRFALARIQAAVPGLAYRSAAGRLSGEVVIAGFSLQRPGLDIKAERVALRIEPSSLFGGGLRLATARIDGLRVQRLPEAAPAALSPPIDLPKVRVTTLVIDDGVLLAADGSDLARGSLDAALELHGQRITLDRLRVQLDAWQGQGRMTINLADPWWLDEVLLDAETDLGRGLRVKGRLQRVQSGDDRRFRLRLEQPLRADLDIEPGPNFHAVGEPHPRHMKVEKPSPPNPSPALPEHRGGGKAGSGYRSNLNDFHANPPTFTAELRVPTQSAEALGLPATEPLAATLKLRGIDGELAVSGPMQLAGQAFTIADGRLAYRAGRVHIDTLLLDLPDFHATGKPHPRHMEVRKTVPPNPSPALPEHRGGSKAGVLERTNPNDFHASAVGRLTLDGSVPLSAGEALDLAVHSDDLQITAAEGAPWQIAGTLSIGGPWQQLTAQPDVTVRRGQGPELRVSGDLALNAESLDLAPLQLQSANGSLSIRGQIARNADAASALDLTLADFDPGMLLPDWPGRLRGDARWRGRLSSSAAFGRLQINAISGQLRGHPARLAGHLDLAGQRIERADLNAKVGVNTLRLLGDRTAGSTLHVDLHAPDLSALWPEARGALTIKLDRDRDWVIAASGSDLRWQDGAVAKLSMTGHLPIAAPDRAAKLHARMSGLSQGNFAIDSATFDLDGSGDQQRIALVLQKPGNRLALTAAGGWSKAGWTGQLLTAELHREQRGGLRLSAASALQFDTGQLKLGTTCIEAITTTAAEGRACFSLDHDAAATLATLQLEHMPIDRLGAFHDAAALPLLRGHLDGEATLSWQQGSLASAHAKLRSTRIELTNPDRDDLGLIFDDLDAQLDFDQGHGVARLRSALLPEGRISAEVALQSNAAGALDLDGAITLALNDLAALELLVPEIAKPKGRLVGQLRLSGPWRAPDWRGSLTLSDFDAELPRLGVHLEQGQLQVTGRDGKLELEGSLRSGQGTLSLSGHYQPGARADFAVRVHGQGVELANTSSATLIATPELNLQHDQDGWRWQGRIEVPSARIDAERLAPVETQSEDVVVIDDPPAAATGFGDWRADLVFVLGDQVRIKGYGFDGKLTGTLAVSQRRDRASVASGQLEVNGDYSAYGQELRIDRGRLSYAGSGLDEPSLDLRAARKVGARTVGIHITGTARQPLSQVYANPALSESEALALLVTGRPLNQVKSSDQRRLSSAALALGSIGGDMLARTIGVDEIGVGNDDTLQGDAFTVGKFLSPRLYIGYAVALLSRGDVFTVRYRLSEHVDVEAHASERNRVLLNYRIER